MSATTSPNRATYRNRIWAWVMYDWANSGVITLVVAAVFPVFFNAVAAAEFHEQGATIFPFVLTISILLSAIVGPIVGTLSDILGSRKRLLIISTVLGSVCVLAMFTIRTGMWVWASLLYITFQIFLNTALGLYNALLSHVAPTENQDRVSSLGYALGYVGGGILLALGLGLILFYDKFGIEQELATRISIAASGIWWLAFSLPLFFAVPEPNPAPLSQNATGNAIRDTFRQLSSTFNGIRQYRQLFIFLIAFWLYSDGIGTIIQLATTYGQEQIKLDQTVLIGSLLLTQIVAFPFALMFGRLPDKASKGRAFYLAFIAWTVFTFPPMGLIAARTNPGVGTTFTLIAINQVLGLILSWIIGRHLFAGLAEQMTTKGAILLGLGVYTVISLWGFVLSTGTEFWMLAWLVGTVQGGTQALSRSLYASMSPSAKSGEFFGFYSFSDKFAGILSPLIFGVIGALTKDLRLSVLSVVIFFILGGLVLLRVNVEEGQRVARAEEELLDYHEHYYDMPSGRAAKPTKTPKE